ncbi:hypothetical protein TrVFT333_001664 [Trichoderma virens FT-333]|nr:hypothetical protein TrVFT333_001664 [Trichoderma virens FT-333]
MIAAKLTKRPNDTKRVPRYNSDQHLDILGRRIHYPSENDKVQPDGNISQYKLKRLSVREIRWGLLIVDEAHMARRLEGVLNQAFRLLNWRHLMWVTGTPLSNLQDILSPLSLIWKKVGIKVPGIWPIKAGDLEGLWSEDDDLFKRENVFADGFKIHGIFAESFAAENPSTEWRKLKDFYRRTRIKLWQIDPSLVELAGREAEWSTKFGKKVVPVILGIVSLRRTLRSRLILPDGSISFLPRSRHIAHDHLDRGTPI